MSFQHARFPVYAMALDVATRLDQISLSFPERRHDLQDQLRRASASIVLNIAEGAGEFSAAEKARFYRIARRSASECAATLDLVERITASPSRFDAEKRSLDDLAASLTLLSRSLARR